MYKLVAILLTLFFIERFIEGKNSPVSYTTSKSTVISFKPETTYAPPAVNDSFIDSIFIGGISTSNPLYGWQVDVHYDSDAVHSPYCMEGPFMKSNGATSTIFVFSNNIDPYFPAELIIGGSLGPGVPKEYAVSGSGYVCKIIWKVKSGKNSVLDITRVDNDTWWMDTCLTKFLFDTEVDGYFKWSPSMIEEPKNSKTQNPKLEMDVYPNPFSRRTTIDIRLKTKDLNMEKESLVYGLRSPVSLKIYDLTGRLVKSFPAYHLPLLTSISWAGTDNSGKFLPSGIYFCRLDMCNEYVVKQISILK